MDSGISVDPPAPQHVGPRWLRPKVPFAASSCPHHRSFAGAHDVRALLAKRGKIHPSFLILLPAAVY